MTCNKSHTSLKYIRSVGINTDARASETYSVQPLTCIRRWWELTGYCDKTEQRFGAHVIQEMVKGLAEPWDKGWERQ